MSIEPVQLFRDKGQDHTYYMKMALKEAAKAFKNDEVPIGAILIHQDTIIGRGYNQCESLRDPTAHAEIVAIRNACKKVYDNNKRFVNDLAGDEASDALYWTMKRILKIED